MSSCPTRNATAGKHSATLIFLHGLGDTGDGWLGLLSEICEDHIKVMCPNAPFVPVTMAGGAQMSSWFDIQSLSMDSEEDEKGILESSEVVKKYVDDEVKRGIPYERIVVGGFSQGGAVALHAFMTIQHRIGAYVGLSTFLPLRGKFNEIPNIANKDTLCFLGHGSDDPVVRVRYGKMSRDVLEMYYTNVQWHKYTGLDHSADPKEMKDVKRCLQNILPAST